MLRTTLAGLRLHKGRLFTTALAIVLGVMFVTGTLVFTDTLRHGYRTQALGGVDRLDALAYVEEPGGEKPSGLGPDTLRAVRDLPEVADAAGLVHGTAALLDERGRAAGQVPTLGLSLPEDEALHRYPIVTGRAPGAADEAALLTSTARQTGQGIGDEVEVAGADGETHVFTVVGLVDGGVDPELNHRGALFYTPATAAELTGRADYAEIDVIGAEGVPQERVAEAVRAAVVAEDAGAVTVATGQDYAEELSAAAGLQARTIGSALLLFAAVAVFVGALVIYNTFAILIAQRRRETALLRCAGATRAQVFRGVLTEALVTGLLSSALGVAAGVGLGVAGFAVLTASQAETVPVSPVVGPVSIVAGLAVGTVVTLASALVPAARATRVPPLAALREGMVADVPEGRRAGVVRVVGALPFLTGSALLCAVALRGEPGETAMGLAAAAGLLAFIGVVALGPLLVRLLAPVFGVVLRRAGVAGTLAADNVRRSPRRAATAMIALTVGVTLVSGYSVIAASIEQSVEDKLDRQFPIDYALSRYYDDENAGIPGEIAEGLRDDGIFTEVYTTRVVDAEVDGVTVPVGTVTGISIAEGGRGGDVEGDLDAAVEGTAVLKERVARELDVTVGDTLSLATHDGERATQIVAVVGDDTILPGVTLPERDFATGFDRDADEMVYVVLADGVSGERARAVLEEAIADEPTVALNSVGVIKEQYTAILDQVFLVVAALLGLAILIAVFGIANTMALSVLERARESALLRALGLSTARLRVMVGAEAVVVSVIGGVVGVALGVLFGSVTGRVVMEGAAVAVPVGEIALFVGTAAVAGLLSALLPSRVAARASITASLAAE
ncbi:ABC transporter permease [Marinactinospora thermotolerans]|uniref:ABC transporter permease n=1 Tax=Marinactinospora thermotolerans TaxID=531310 RepID=UPI003D8D034F